MGLYQYSWLILFAPLFSFAVIIFGTRMWDLATRAQVEPTASHEEKEEAEEASGIHLVEREEPPGINKTLEVVEDLQVPHLTMGAKMSGYLGILIIGLTCIYSWILLLNTSGVINIAPALPAGGAVGKPRQAAANPGSSSRPRTSS